MQQASAEMAATALRPGTGTAVSTTARPGMLGCDIGGTAIEWVVLDGERVVGQGERPIPLTGESDVVEALAVICRSAGSLDTVGIGMPAVVNSVRGQVVTVPNLVGASSGGDGDAYRLRRSYRSDCAGRDRRAPTPVPAPHDPPRGRRPLRWGNGCRSFGGTQSTMTNYKGVNDVEK
jgi:hypothetical protein